MSATFTGTLDEAVAWAASDAEPGAKAATLSPDAQRWETNAHRVRALKAEVAHAMANWRCADPADWQWASKCLMGLQEFCTAVENRLADELIQ